jgi:hypothetical protein
MLDWNRRKEENMPKSLSRGLITVVQAISIFENDKNITKSYIQAYHLEKKYRKEFEALLGTENESQMQEMANALLEEGISYKGEEKNLN